MIEQSKGSRKKLVIVGTLGIPHGQPTTQELTAGTVPAIEKPMSDEQFEDIKVGDVSGDFPVLSGALPMTVDEDRPVHATECGILSPLMLILTT
jgi:hypothetical protein